VLEIGGGTGANLPFYGSGIEELVITEPEEPMARRLERKLGDYSLPTRVVRAPAEELPFEDESFDFVVSTLVLCTVDDPARAALKPAAYEVHQWARLATMLIVIAMITTPNIHEMSACRTAARRISLACRLVSDTWYVIPIVRAT
jgi:Methyltransferase domain